MVCNLAFNLLYCLLWPELELAKDVGKIKQIENHHRFFREPCFCHLLECALLSVNQDDVFEIKCRQSILLKTLCHLDFCTTVGNNVVNQKETLILYIRLAYEPTLMRSMRLL